MISYSCVHKGFRTSTSVIFVRLFTYCLLFSRHVPIFEKSLFAFVKNKTSHHDIDISYSSSSSKPYSISIFPPYTMLCVFLFFRGRLTTGHATRLLEMKNTTTIKQILQCNWTGLKVHNTGLNVPGLNVPGLNVLYPRPGNPTGTI